MSLCDTDKTGIDITRIGEKRMKTKFKLELYHAVEFVKTVKEK